MALRKTEPRPDPPMPFQIHGRPFPSYTRNAMTACHENALAFEFLNLAPDNPDTCAEFARRWPTQRSSLLVEGERQVMEATSIIEYLHVHHPGPSRLIARPWRSPFPLGAPDRD